jgi:chromosome segregation ATPase
MLIGFSRFFLICMTQDILLTLLIAAPVFLFIGWSFRNKSAKSLIQRATQQSTQEASKASRLERDLQQIQREHQSLTQAFDQLKKTSSTLPSPEVIDQLRQQLDAAQTEASSHLSQAQKARQALDAANNRASESVKSAQEKAYALESELSKAREEISRLRSNQVQTPKDSGELQQEILQLKQSLATATQAMGHAHRERDTLKADLQRLQQKLNPGFIPAEETAKGSPTPSSIPIGPLGPNPAAARQRVEELKRKPQQEAQSA